MSNGQSNGVIRELRKVRPDLSGRTDADLLADFLRRDDGEALAALVRRHGPMVWAVCRRVVGHHQDAEDAFQATFLVLVRRAASIASGDLLANWLYGTAHLTAMKARSRAARRRERERQVPEIPEPMSREPSPQGGPEPALDDELARLPARYRTVVVLCDLQGHTRQEAARQLGCPEGTVASRLARARAMLARRLTRRGISLSGGALAAMLTRDAVSAGVPHWVVDATIHAARSLSAGRAAVIPTRVSALTEDVMKTVLLTKLKATVALVLALGLATVGAMLVASHSAGQEPKGAAIKPVGPAVPQQPEKKTTEFAWGKAVDGLQLGLALVPGERTTYRPGEEIALDVAVRNVAKAPITIRYGIPESEPEVTDASGRKVVVTMPPILDIVVAPTEQVLKPGEWTVISHRKIAVEAVPTQKPDPNAIVGLPTVRVPAGKYRIAFSEFVGDKLLLASGPVKVEVTEKEPFTAWGTDVNGLQAGLGFRTGDQKVYRHGETITLVLRLRNVGTETVKFSYLRPFIEHSLTVAGQDGKALTQPEVIPDFGVREAGQEELAPGKELVLHELNCQLRPASEIGKSKNQEGRLKLYGTGRVTVLYEQVFGPPEMGTPGWKLDPSLGKLATGKLELNVTEPEPDVKRPATEKSKPEEPPAGGKQSPEHKLTPKDAAALLPEAASLPIKDFETLLAKKALPKANQSPTWFVLTFAPTGELPGGSDQDFQWTSDRINPEAVARALAVSKGQGFASILQARYITDCTCESDGEQARGRVAFQCDLYKGTINFKATKVKGDWSIREFEWPHLGVRFVRGEDNTWRQEKITPETGKEPPPKKDADGTPKPIKIRVYIEKVNVDTSTITASCMLIGEMDGVTKPLRLENLRVSEKAKITDGGKDLKLADLKRLPADTHYYLFLKSYEEELGFEVLGIETIGK